MSLVLDVVADVVCPWCYIGKRRLERALAGLCDDDTQVTWRPFQLNPGLPRSGIDRGEYLALKFGGREQASAAYAPIEAAGRAEGIPFAFDRIRRTPNTLDAHRLIRAGQRARCQDPIVEALFRAYFVDGRDIGDTLVLADIGAACGLEVGSVRAFLASDEDVDSVLAEDAVARRMGIDGVPAFIIDRTYALAGAHGPAELVAAFEQVARLRAAERAEQVAH